MLKSVAGRKVPFTPKLFPVRLSKRVGLRHMQSVGGKVPLPSDNYVYRCERSFGYSKSDFSQLGNGVYVYKSHELTMYMDDYKISDPALQWNDDFETGDLSKWDGISRQETSLNGMVNTPTAEEQTLWLRTQFTKEFTHINAMLLAQRVKHTYMKIYPQ